MTQDYPATGNPPMIGKVLSIPEWLTYLEKYQFGTLKATKVVLHHTWRPSVQQWAGLRSMQGMQRFYAGKGWNSAPHLYIGPDGIWLFTPLRDIGIHAGTGNGSVRAGWYSIGIEMVGDYDRERPSGAIWEATRAVMGSLSRRLGIKPRDLIAFHRDYSSKSCPGWAVTKDWVFAEVEAWLNNATPPPPPPIGPIGTPTPADEEVIEVLNDQSYARRGEGYNSSWAFHQFATQNKLGFPLARSSRIEVGGKAYAFQPFARDTLYNEVPNWGDVQRLSELLAGSIPPEGSLGRALLDATYSIGGAKFNPGWAFHQYAVAGKTLGPPLAESKAITVDGVQYSYQIYATDTIYNRGTDWKNIQRLSALANTSDPAQVKVRDTLLGEAYKAAGQQYHPEWAFHQLARTWDLGAPLGATQPVQIGGHSYNFQAYATDTIYNIDQKWNDVKRLSALSGPKAALLAGGGGLPLLARDTSFEQDWADKTIVTYTIPGVAPAACGSRGGSRGALIVLHGDRGPAPVSLLAMASPAARRMTHYYVAADGNVYQLVDDELAAWHAGMALWEGRRRNINRSSIGIAIETGGNGYNAAQHTALKNLITLLSGRYELERDAVVRWGALQPRFASDLATLDIASLTE
ncbi:MAG TPA: N-acetylmuramoyl-L-alanine amidase [Roseiflexaceae bacterium]|nr:N-acetylmuramoyl-L-alanine amidase [Roseiflexaceae bacterium]